MIDAPIGRSTARRTRMAVRESGKVARTEYEVRTVFVEPECSLLDCRLETGRTHQIRVHLSAIGHPIVGDGTYGGSRDVDPARPPVPARDAPRVRPPGHRRALAFDDPLPPALEAVLAHLE